MITQLQLCGIARAGGSIVVDAEKYTALGLKGVAATLRNGATITIKNARRFTALQCEDIASVAPLGQVVFDFSQ